MLTNEGFGTTSLGREALEVGEERMSAVSAIKAPEAIRSAGQQVRLG
jgi:hypothetical protein